MLSETLLRLWTGHSGPTVLPSCLRLELRRTALLQIPSVAERTTSWLLEFRASGYETVAKMVRWLIYHSIQRKLSSCSAINPQCHHLNAIISMPSTSMPSTFAYSIIYHLYSDLCRPNEFISTREVQLLKDHRMTATDILNGEPKFFLDDRKHIHPLLLQHPKTPGWTSWPALPVGICCLHTVKDQAV